MPQAGRSVPEPVPYVCVCRNKHMINFWQMCDTKEMWHTSVGYDAARRCSGGWGGGGPQDGRLAATLAGILSASAKLLSRGFSAWLGPWHQVPHANPFGLIDCSCALWAGPKRDLSHTWGAAARVKVVRLFGVPTCWRSPATLIHHSLIN